MKTSAPIPIVDLFAGPGGLGEGFSSLNSGNAFKILISAEMDPAAHATLMLRAYYRILKKQNLLKDYYNFCNGKAKLPYSKDTQKYWIEASEEAQRLTLGEPEDNKKLESIINNAKLKSSKPWVLIGGPPCQAYSLVGRSRNIGKPNYRAEEDHRHYLYKEYLKVIQEFKPTVFVMENVKGILSSKIQGGKIFHSILKDLSDPNKALENASNVGYKIYSLALPTCFDKSQNPEDLKLSDFIIKSEEYGIPQARHRVILLGVREDIKKKPCLINRENELGLNEVINDLPRIRSSLSKEIDSDENWSMAIKNHLASLINESRNVERFEALSPTLEATLRKIDEKLDVGGLRVQKESPHQPFELEISKWYCDKKLNVWLNHEARGHMRSDLKRYIFAACFANTFKRSPKGHEDFILKGLSPEHKNWESGKFSDRFRVQTYNKPATTITSHISKDGHYFIHPDPTQCRSLTVREAARVQTFPDNYFFQGNRTQQYHQVGNAVPPLLAYKIAKIVFQLLS